MRKAAFAGFSLLLGMMFLVGAPSPTEATEKAIGPGIPDFNNSFVVPGDNAFYTSPGGGVPLGSATYEIFLFDINNNPVVGYPPDLVRMSLQGAPLCPNGASIADAPTDADGRTTISEAPASGGYLASSTVQFFLDGLLWTSVATGMPTPSVDLIADLDVNLCDENLFFEYFANQDLRADFNLDGSVDFADVGRFAQHFCDACSNTAPPPLTPGGELGIFFDAAGTQTSTTISPFTQFNFYVVARNIPEGIRAMAFGLQVPPDIQLLNANVLDPQGTAGILGCGTSPECGVLYQSGCVTAAVPTAVVEYTALLIGNGNGLNISLLPPSNNVCAPRNSPFYQSCLAGCDLRAFTNLGTGVVNPPVPDLSNSFVVPGSNFFVTSPSGQSPLGSATYEVFLRDSANNPIQGYPANLIQMTVLGPPVACQDPFSIASGPTDNLGRTTIELAPPVGGHINSSVVQFFLDGASWTNIFTGLPTPSYDLSPDLAVNMCDQNSLITAFNNQDLRADYNNDGVVDLFDIGQFAAFVCDRCDEGIAQVLPEQGTIGVYFDAAGTQTTLDVNVAGSPFEFYVVARGVPGGLRGITYDLAADPNILISNVQVLVSPPNAICGPGNCELLWGDTGCQQAQTPEALVRYTATLATDTNDLFIRVLASQFDCEETENPAYQTCANGCELQQFGRSINAIVNPQRVNLAIVSGASDPISIYSVPDGSGAPFSDGISWNGVLGTPPVPIDGTIKIKANYLNGAIASGIGIGISTSEGGLVLCPSNPLPVTDASGVATFDQALFASGATVDDEDLLFFPNVNFVSLDNYKFNSADIFPDGKVDLGDVGPFSADLDNWGTFGIYNYRSDFFWDGLINLADIGPFSAALNPVGATCPDIDVEPLKKPVGMDNLMSIYFDLEGKSYSRDAKPGELIEAHLLLKGPATAAGLEAWEARVAGSRNVEIEEWVLPEGSINLKEAPNFVVGMGGARKATGTALHLATLRLRVTDGEPAYLRVLPGPLGTRGSDVPAIALAATDAVDLRPVAIPDDGPAAFLNDPNAPARDGQAPDRVAVAVDLRNVPNPFNPATEIKFNLPRRGTAEARVFDLAGRLVRRLGGAVLEAGPHSLRWDGTDDHGSGVVSGQYFTKLYLDGEPLGSAARMSLVK